MYVYFYNVFRGDNCIKKTWTYHLHPERDDLELEGIYCNISIHRCSKHNTNTQNGLVWVF